MIPCCPIISPWPEDLSELLNTDVFNILLQEKLINPILYMSSLTVPSRMWPAGHQLFFIIPLSHRSMGCNLCSKLCLTRTRLTCQVQPSKAGHALLTFLQSLITDSPCGHCALLHRLNIFQNGQFKFLTRGSIQGNFGSPMSWDNTPLIELPGKLVCWPGECRWLQMRQQKKQAVTVFVDYFRLSQAKF